MQRLVTGYSLVFSGESGPLFFIQLYLFSVSTLRYLPERWILPLTRQMIRKILWIVNEKSVCYSTLLEGKVCVAEFQNIAFGKVSF